WPSRVDAALAMMQMEDAAFADTVIESYDPVTGEFTYKVIPHVGGESDTNRVPLTIALNNCITGFTADNRPVPHHYPPPLRVVIVTNDQAPGPDWDFRWDFGFLTPMKFGTSSLQAMISYLDRFPDGSISELIISGHTGTAGCGAAVVGGQNIGRPFNNIGNIPGPLVSGALVRADSGYPLNISAGNIKGDLATAIRRKLRPNATVRLLSCNATAIPKSVQDLANNLQATIIANSGLVGGTGDDDTDGIWSIFRPIGPPR
ncbi:MAG: hypothetical protein ABI619_09190, partial [Betaproteobacteria bacterium]